MDAKDIIIDMYNSYIHTNKNFMELSKVCRKAFARQDRVNSRLFGTVLLGVGYVIFSEKKRKEQEETIQELSKELKTMKGE